MTKIKNYGATKETFKDLEKAQAILWNLASHIENVHLAEREEAKRNKEPEPEALYANEVIFMDLNEVQNILIKMMRKEEARGYMIK